MLVSARRLPDTDAIFFFTHELISCSRWASPPRSAERSGTAAVVAREFGLPAVVNLPGATKRFRTGDILRVDGTTGEVRRLR
jgi:PEP-utilising enzyme, mobile domain